MGILIVSNPVGVLTSRGLQAELPASHRSSVIATRVIMAGDIGIRHPEIKYTQVSPFYSDIFTSLPLLVSTKSTTKSIY